MAISCKESFEKNAVISTISSEEGFPIPLNMLTGRSFASAEEEAKAMRIIKQMESWCADTHKHKAQMYAIEDKLNSLGYTPQRLAQMKKDKESVNDVEVATLIKQKEYEHKAAQDAKKHLIKIMYHATFPEGRSTPGIGKRAVANGLCIFDWDNIRDITPFEQYQRVVKDYADRGQNFIEQEHVFVVHATPSKQGLRFVFAADPEYSIKENQQRFAERLKVPADQYDTSVNDLSRISYGVPPTHDYVYHYDSRVFTYFSKEYSERWSTWRDESTGPQVAPTVKVTYATSAARQQLAEDIAAEACTDQEELTYQGIPYSVIIKKWWEMYNGGAEPFTSNRDVLTYELAVNLRNICGFDRATLNRVIPCYDGFAESEKLKCIDSALRADRTRMPRRLIEVLNSLKRCYTDTPSIIDAIDEVDELGELYYINRIDTRVLPMGVIDSLDGVRNVLQMPALIAIGPMIGALATDVELSIHGEPFNLNLSARIIGESGSGKSTVDPLWDIWMHALIAEHKAVMAREKAYKALPTKEKDKTKRPPSTTRIMSLRTSIAEILTRADGVPEKHLVSFTAELDQLAQNRGSSSMDSSAIERVSYDNKKYDTDYKSDSAGNGYIEKVKWNTIACGTPDALYRSLKFCLAGDVQRLSIARTPGDEFSKLVIVPRRTQKSADNIRRIASLLPLMKGTVDLTALEKRCRQWLEKIRLECIRDDDRVRAGLRKRPCISAMRYVCCFLLCAYAELLIKKIEKSKNPPAWTQGCKTPEEYLTLHPEMLEKHLRRLLNDKWLNIFDVLSDYLLDNLDFYFHNPITTAKDRMDNDYATRHRRRGKNRSIYSSLPPDFNFDQAMAAKGTSATRNSVHQMLKNWVNQGLIEVTGEMQYRKVDKQ